MSDTSLTVQAILNRAFDSTTGALVVSNGASTGSDATLETWSVDVFGYLI